MGVVDKVENALHLGGHGTDHQHHHHDHKTEQHETTTTGPGGVTTGTTKTSSLDHTGTQGAGAASASGTSAVSDTSKTTGTDSTATHATQAVGQTADHTSTNAATSAQQTAAASNTGTTSSVHKEENVSTPAGSTQTTVTKSTGPAIGGQHDGQSDHNAATTSGTRHDTPVARHDQAHEGVDFKPNLENPDSIPTAGGKDIGAGEIDHNATGTIGKDMDATGTTGLGSDHGHEKPTSGDHTNEHAVQSDNKHVSDPSTSTGPGNTVNPASAGLTTAGLDHDNTTHARGH